MTHVSLFSGIGGLDLAAEWAGFETILQVEMDDYANRVLEKHWPDVRRIRDVREVTREKVEGEVTLLSGGFPCQPFSSSGKRRGREDDRYLWPEMLRVVRELKPRYIVGENVSGLVSINEGLEIESIITDVENEGYEVWAGIIPACGVGAPHRRDRVFIIAHSEHPARKSKRERKQKISEKLGASYKGRVYTQDVADTGCKHESGNTSGMETDKAERTTRKLSFKSSGKGQGRQWEVEPDVGRVAHGISSRMDRLKCLGNAVVPQQAYPIFRAIAEVECGRKV
jgi:DNA (cytosine-5)-methyltransferase 1